MHEKVGLASEGMQVHLWKVMMVVLFGLVVSRHEFACLSFLI